MKGRGLWSLFPGGGGGGGAPGPQPTPPTQTNEEQTGSNHLVTENARRHTQTLCCVFATSNSSPVLLFPPIHTSSRCWEIQKKMPTDKRQRLRFPENGLLPCSVIWWQIRCQFLTTKAHNFDPNQLSPKKLKRWAAYKISGLLKA